MQNILIKSLALLFMAVLCNACQTRMDTDRGSEIITPVMKKIDLIARPRDIREDVSYPLLATRQIFTWHNNTVDWTLRFPQDRYAYAGLVFAKPLDLEKMKGRGALLFRMFPATARPYLTAILIDGDQQEYRVMVDYPLSGCTNASVGQWHHVNIPLGSFSENGFAAASTNAAFPAVETTAPFDWSDVCEFRLVTSGMPSGMTNIIIKVPRIQP